MENSMDRLIGITIGDFEIREVIGRGGMSSVYLAADKELERDIALKIPHERFLEKSSFVTRFRREAKAMARLRHPNIVQIYSVGNHGEIPFFAMEHVHGNSLEQVIREKGPLKVEKAVKYISQIARAIDYAHKKGVVHRDIKPANILVDSSGRLLVSDFGVSKFLSDEATQDTVGFIGTPQYMSPEQCGQGTLDHRTDIYSMGAVLFEMLTGQAAFSSDSPAEVIKKQLFDMPEFPAEFVDKIPDKLRAIISKMLAKEPEKRYPNVRAFLRDIEKLDRESEEATMALPPDKMAEIRKAARPTALDVKKKSRWRRGLAIACACALVLCATAFLVAFQWGDRVGVDLSPIASLIDGLHRSEGYAAISEKLFRAETVEPEAVSPGNKSDSMPPPIEPKAGLVVSSAAVTPQWAKAVINSVPEGAEVFLDSMPRGVTPLELSEIPPGKHMLAMKLDGYPDYDKEAMLDPEAPLEVLHDFERAKDALIPRGSLTVDSEPSGAAVYINGERRGVTRLELPDLLSADYEIALELDGYRRVRKKVKLLKDENLRVSLSLIPKPKYGGLSIHSDPGRAEVFLNGEYKGATPLLLSKLEVGEYDVTLKKQGYRPYQQNFTCEEDSTRVIKASLEMTPKSAAMESMIAGDRHAQMGELNRAIAAYERAMSLDPDSPVYQQKKIKVTRALLKMEIKSLLSSYELAYDNENADLLGTLLDRSNSEFFSSQVANAENLFREFDNIDMALSDPRVSVKDRGEVSLELHLILNADYGETGVSAELLDANQTMTLRRSPKAGWKICAIE
jgi:tetratricopeptide (TPR) repeat protein/predicted Ser/Thr protein kinase